MDGGCIVHVRTCNLVRHLCRENKSTIELNYSYIYDFDPKAMLKQCRPLVQNRSDFELGLCFSIGRSMNEDFLWWVG